jgi:hypothetical protein
MSYSHNEAINFNLKNFLKEADLDYSFNHNPDRYLSRSLTQTKLKKFQDCPSCFFNGAKKEIIKSDEIILSNTIHYLADHLIRNQDKFPNSHSVLDFINFTEGNFLEFLKTQQDNLNYDILEFLYSLKDDKTKNNIIKSTLIVYGTAKRLGFEETRKKDHISLNLKNTRNKASLTLYTKPDYTGRNKTLYPKSGRKFDNFLIDYKLNFSESNKNNSLQMAFYLLTHSLSNRKIHNYFILDITSGNLFLLEKINLNYLFKILDKFLILKNLNYRGKNPKHNCNYEINSIQENFLDNLDIENFGESFGTKTYKELLLQVKNLEESLVFKDLGKIVREEELAKIVKLYPIKN